MCETLENHRGSHPRCGFSQLIYQVFFSKTALYTDKYMVCSSSPKRLYPYQKVGKQL